MLGIIQKQVLIETCADLTFINSKDFEKIQFNERSENDDPKEILK